MPYPSPETLAILAEGSSHVLLGTEEGEILSCTRLLYDIRFKDYVRHPKKFLIPPDGLPEYLGLKIEVRPDLPPETHLIFHHVTHVGIHIQVAYEEPRKLWHLRELRSSPGNYFEEVNA